MNQNSGNMRKVWVFTVMMLLCSGLSAQLITREDAPSVLRFGTRPLAGNYGVFLGPSIFGIADLIRTTGDVGANTFLLGLPMINVKYYKTDDIEWRLGIQMANEKTRLVGESDTTLPDIGNQKELLSESIFRLTPAITRHFSKKNIMDVYMGGGIVLGMNGYREITEFDNLNSRAISQTVFVGGFSFIMGMQAFIADLPVAVGIEYGISALGHYGMQYKISEMNAGKEQLYYMDDLNDLNQYYKLKVKNFMMGNDLRITLSYFFFR
jgi:hypothetical protein